MYSNWIARRFEAFLQEAPPELTALGTDRAAAPVKEAPELQRAQDALVEQLRYRRAFARNMVILIVTLYCIAFGLATAYVISRWETDKVMLLITGQAGSLLAVIAALYYFFREVTAVELLVAFLPGLPPAEAVKVIREWYAAKQARDTGGGG